MGEGFDEVREIREAHAEVPDEILLVLIGDMVTEEALPTYLTLLNTLEGTDDPTGAVDQRPRVLRRDGAHPCMMAACTHCLARRQGRRYDQVTMSQNLR